MYPKSMHKIVTVKICTQLVIEFARELTKEKNTLLAQLMCVLIKCFRGEVFYQNQILSENMSFSETKLLQREPLIFNIKYVTMLTIMFE